MEQITAFNNDGVETITGVGELDLRFGEQFRQALSDAVASGHEIVVDLRQASYIDTAIVAALVPPAKAMLERGGRLKVLVTSGGYPNYVLKTVRFADIMEIVAEEDSTTTER